MAGGTAVELRRETVGTCVTVLQRRCASAAPRAGLAGAPAFENDVSAEEGEEEEHWDQESDMALSLRAGQKYGTGSGVGGEGYGCR